MRSVRHGSVSGRLSVALALGGAMALGALAVVLGVLPGCGGSMSDASSQPTARYESAGAAEYPRGAYMRSQSMDADSGARIRRNAAPAPPSSAASMAPDHYEASQSSVALDQNLRSISGAMPSRDEELWVIARAPRSSMRGDDVPGCGSMLALRGGGTTPIPLEHTAVEADIAGHIASVRVVQRYHNPFSEKIEAAYVFPLPENAAVNEFVMQIGDRRIRGVIREREEAERIYEEARGAGHVSSLLTQERPNIFTQKVANIEPGKRIDVDIRYFHTLAYDDGWHEWVFPMVVGPRFNPSRSDDPILTARHGEPHAQTTPLAPGERSGHDVSLAVRVHPGAEIGSIEAVSHDVRVERESSDGALVTLRGSDTIPNRDFVLRYRVAADTTRAAVVTYERNGERWFMASLYPAPMQDERDRLPMEVVFVLDCSGSMEGAPLAQAKAAAEAGLRRLRPSDTFQIIRFSDQASTFSDGPVAATEENTQRAIRYARGLYSEGGTMMTNGVKAALKDADEHRRLRFVVFLTDGFIGNEAEVLGLMHDRIGRTRVFSFGVGSSPNRYLMDRMAKTGRGAVAYLSLEDDGAEVMDSFFDRVTRPVMTDLELLVNGRPMRGALPASAPDLFAGRMVTFAGRLEGDWPMDARVRGRLGDREVEMPIALEPWRGATSPALPAVVARLEIADLTERAIVSPRADLERAITRIALANGLMSAFTAYVAVDATRVTEGHYGVSVDVPTPTPAGMRYETTVHRER